MKKNFQDQGIMGSRSALMAIGLFSSFGGTNPDPYQEIPAPILDTVTLKPDSEFYPGGTFTTRTVNP